MLIGLTGAVGAGKDSAGQVLCSGGWHSVALADALRVEVAAAWHIDPRWLTDRATKEVPLAALAAGHAMDADWLHRCAVIGYTLTEPRSPRWVLQQWGSYRRDHDPLHWIKHVLHWVNHKRAHGLRNLVVTDVRYANEAAALRAWGGRLLRVHRNTLAGPQLASDTARHESEGHTAVAVDGDIHNDGSLADLSAEVWRVVNALREA